MNQLRGVALKKWVLALWAVIIASVLTLNVSVLRGNLHRRDRRQLELHRESLLLRRHLPL